MRVRWSSAWCVLGDFNIIRYPTERLDCNSFSLAMFNFLDFIERNFLVDLPLIGGEYKWFRDSANPFMSRIDRVLDVIQRPLPRVVSDHCPILVEAGGMARGKSPFKFENMWLKVEDFVDQVRGWWNSYHFVGSPSYVLACKFKALKKGLKCWNKHVFGDVHFRKKCLLSELLDLDMREEMQVLTTADKARKIKIKAKIESLASWRRFLGCRNQGLYS